MLRDLIKSISRKEWWLLAAVAIFVILLTSAPYFYGWSQTPTGSAYTGLHSLTPGDVHVYYSYLEQARQGHWLFLDLYSSEPQAHLIFNPFWLTVGLLAKLFSLSNFLVFQLARIIFIPFLLFVLYLLSAYFFTNKNWRRLCFIFLTFASGWGAIFSPFLEKNIYRQGWYDWPLDLWAAENNNLLTMLQSPHLILSTALIILVMFFFFFALEHQKIKYSLASGALASLLFSFHPFHIPTLIGIMAVYLVIHFILNKKIHLDYLKHFIIVCALASPPVLYYFYLASFDFFTRFRTAQNICLSPSLWVTLISYGFIFVLALYAIYQLCRRRHWSNRYIFLVVWLIVQFLFLYSPLPWQRRMMQGLQIPMGILAVVGLRYFYQYLRQKISPRQFDFFINNPSLAVIVFLVIFCPSQFFNWVREFSLFQDENYIEQLYPANDKLAAYQWLKLNMNENDVVLSELANGNFIPGLTGRKVFAGHGVETLFFDSKVGEVVWFFKTNTVDDKKQVFLKNNHITHVFFSDKEAELGDFQPAEK
ncbi:MAG TPA: hypothetical protein P5267_03510, partial [Patescibacteria group bacterium]|nr:hypothetical protein [Patescibacteria group bacterium]